MPFGLRRNILTCIIHAIRRGTYISISKLEDSITCTKRQIENMKRHTHTTGPFSLSPFFSVFFCLSVSFLSEKCIQTSSCIYITQPSKILTANKKEKKKKERKKERETERQGGRATIDTRKNKKDIL